MNFKDQINKGLKQIAVEARNIRESARIPTSEPPNPIIQLNKEIEDLKNLLAIKSEQVKRLAAQNKSLRRGIAERSWDNFRLQNEKSSLKVSNQSWQVQVTNLSYMISTLLPDSDSDVSGYNTDQQ